MADLIQRLRDHAARHAEISRFSDEQAQWGRDLLEAAELLEQGAAVQPSPARDDARDAARYRWLVANAKNVPWSRQFPGLHAGKGLDDAIDKAIADSTEGSEL